MTKRLIVLSFVLGLMSQAAFAGAKVSLLGVGDFAKTHTSASGISIDTSQESGFGGGAQIEIDMSHNLGLEIGALYLTRKTGFPTFGDLTFHYLQFPALLRIWFNSMVGLGLGVQYSSAMGDISDSAGNTTPYSTAGIKKSDFGAVGSLAFAFPIGHAAALRIEGRYVLGLQDINDPAQAGVTTKWQDIQALVGVTFALGK